MTMRIQRHQGFGVEINNADINENVSNTDFQEQLRQMLLSEHLVVFRNQNLEPRKIIELSKALGDLRNCPDPRYELEGYPEITVIGASKNRNTENTLFLNDKIEWHFDLAQEKFPALFTFLYAVEAPAEGGDTLFANGRSAYKALSPMSQQRARELEVQYSYQALNLRLDEADHRRSKQSAPHIEPSIHSLAFAHVETEARAVLLAPHIATVKNKEDEEFLLEIFEFTTQSKFLHRHKWSEGDLVICDNMSTIHTATPFNRDAFNRIVYRTTVMSPKVKGDNQNSKVKE